MVQIWRASGELLRQIPLSQNRYRLGYHTCKLLIIVGCGNDQQVLYIKTNHEALPRTFQDPLHLLVLRP